MTMGKSSAAREFPADARAIMDRIIEEGISNFDATMELLSLSLTAKVGITGPGGIREVLVAWIMDQIDVESGNGAAVQAASDRIWEKYGEILVKNNCHESGLVDEVQVRRSTGVPSKWPSCWLTNRFGIAEILCAAPSSWPVLPVFRQEHLRRGARSTRANHRVVQAATIPRCWRIG
jgi:hypothetical protein